MKTLGRWAIAGLLFAHLLLGILAAWLGTLGSWAAFYEVVFAGLVCAQAVLLGSWAGLARQPLGIKATGLVCGSLYVAGVVAIGTNMRLLTDDVAVLLGLVLTTTAFVSMLFVSWGRYREVEVVRLCTIKSYASTPLRFTVRQLLGGTALLSVLLGSGQAVRSLGGEALGIGVILATFVICGCIMAWLVVWASLGLGRPLSRIFIVLTLGCVIGLFPPLFLGGPWWRLLTWPGLVTATGTIATLSMLVVRSCGYRIVYDKYFGTE